MISRRTFIGGCVAAGAGAALPGKKPAPLWIPGKIPSSTTYTIPAGFTGVIITNKIERHYYADCRCDRIFTISHDGRVVRKA